MFAGRRAAITDTDVKIYLSDVSRFKLLTAEEERTLARKIGKGDEAARKRMIQSNLRLVISIARSYVQRGLPLLDLVAEGNVGLIRAVEQYDPERGCRFSTYATWWIRQAIRRALSDKVRSVRVPAYMSGLASRWRKARDALLQQLGREPQPDEVARKLQVSTRQLRTLRRVLSARTISIYGTEQSGSDSVMSQAAAAADAANQHPSTFDMDYADVTSILQLVLSSREQLILRMRHGLGEFDGRHTLESIGNTIGLTRERVRQIEARAMRKLLSFLSEIEEESERRRLAAQTSNAAGRGRDGLSAVARRAKGEVSAKAKAAPAAQASDAGVSVEPTRPAAEKTSGETGDGDSARSKYPGRRRRSSRRFIARKGESASHWQLSRRLKEDERKPASSAHPRTASPGAVQNSENPPHGTARASGEQDAEDAAAASPKKKKKKKSRRSSRPNLQ